MVIPQPNDCFDLDQGLAGALGERSDQRRRCEPSTSLCSGGRRRSRPPARRYRVNIAIIEFELLRDQSILLITPHGPLEKEDFEQLAKEIDPFIAANGKLVGVMIRTESFPGWESFGALISHLKFVANHHRLNA